MDHDLCGAHLLPEKEEERHMLWLENKFGRSLHEALHEASTSLLHCNCYAAVQQLPGWRMQPWLALNAQHMCITCVPHVHHTWHACGMCADDDAAGHQLQS